MKRMLGSISLQSIACAALCLLLLAGLFLPAISYNGMEKALRTIADGARYYELEELLDGIADTLEKDDYDKAILAAFADYEWDYSSSRKRSGNELETYYMDIYDRLESKMERRVEELEPLLWEYEDELEDILYNGDYSELASVARRVLNEPEVQECIALYLVYLLVDSYCAMDEDAWEAVDMTEYITSLQGYAGAMADRKLSVAEVSRVIKTLSMLVDMLSTEIDLADVDDIREAIDDGSYYGDTTAAKLALGLYDARGALRVAKILWPVLMGVYALAVLGIAALALFGKKKRGFVLSIVVTVVDALMLAAGLGLCAVFNQGFTSGIEMSSIAYLSKTLHVCAVSFWAFLMPFAGAGLAVLTKRLSAAAPHDAGGWSGYGRAYQLQNRGGYAPVNYGGYAPAGWTCVCGNVCGDAQRFCTSCGRGRPVQQTVRRCVRCGYELDADTVFCPSCGQRQ